MSNHENGGCVLNEEGVCTTHGQVAEDCAKDARDAEVLRPRPLNWGKVPGLLAGDAAYYYARGGKRS